MFIRTYVHLVGIKDLPAQQAPCLVSVFVSQHEQHAHGQLMQPDDAAPRACHPHSSACLLSMAVATLLTTSIGHK
jgi:hypothetical protein